MDPFAPVPLWLVGLLFFVVVIPMQWSLYKHGKELKRLRSKGAKSLSRGMAPEEAKTPGGRLGSWLIDHTNAFAAFRGRDPIIKKRDK